MSSKKDLSLCTKCVFAEWRRDTSGRLSRCGTGWCRFVYEPPPLPASMCWIGGNPRPLGGRIERTKKYEHSKFIAECPMFMKTTPSDQ